MVRWIVSVSGTEYYCTRVRYNTISQYVLIRRPVRPVLTCDKKRKRKWISGHFRFRFCVLPFLKTKMKSDFTFVGVPLITHFRRKWSSLSSDFVDRRKWMAFTRSSIFRLFTQMFYRHDELCSSTHIGVPTYEQVWHTTYCSTPYCNHHTITSLHTPFTKQLHVHQSIVIRKLITRIKSANTFCETTRMNNSNSVTA